MRGFWVVAALAAVAACSTTNGTPDDAPDALSGNDAGTTDASSDAIDASPEAARPDPPACLGDVRSATLAGGLALTNVSVGTYAGAFLVDFATTASVIDVTAFASPGPTETNCNGVSCSFADFDFFGPWGSVTLVTEILGTVGGVRQAGIVGTDFLSIHVFSIDWARAQIREAASACDDATLTGAGFAPLSTKGFYANDTSTLKLYSDVDSTSSGTSTVPNVPTVPVRVAGLAAIAQLDTGFQDSVVRHSVNVNEALFAAVAPGTLVRDASLDTSLTTCAGVAEPIEAYRLGPGSTFDLVDESNAAARSWSDAVIFVKHTPAAAKSCGGIGTWTVPAAQVGVSFYVDAGVLVFDPFASRVWIAK